MTINQETPTLREYVVRVAELREGLATLQLEVKAAQQAFALAHADLLSDVAIRAAAVTTAEAELRAVALERFSATEDKAPAPGVSIRIQKRIQYDREQALAWAKAKFYAPWSTSIGVAAGVALTLDTKAFEGLAKHDRTVPAQVIDEPQATIAKDLRAALEAATPIEVDHGA